MRPLNELHVALDDLINGYRFGWIDCKDVVASHLHDQMRYAGGGENIAIKPGQCVRADRIMKDSVPCDSLVHDASLLAVWMIHQTSSEGVGPSLVGVGGGLGAVLDRIPQAHKTGGLAHGHDLD